MKIDSWPNQTNSDTIWRCVNYWRRQYGWTKIKYPL